MNNILVSFKRFITNKNTITVIGIMAILGLLYFGYNKAIGESTQTMRVCIAKSTIQPRTLLTNENVNCATEGLPQWYYNTVKDKIETAPANIIGKYSNINSVIPEGSFIFKNMIVAADQMPSSGIDLVPEGQRPYSLSVNTSSTYGNSIMPGSYIDVYMKAVDENGRVMVGALLEKVKVLAVKDNSGNNVFEDTTANRTPATLLFAVPEDVYVLLVKAGYLRSYGVELFPVPYGGTNAVTGDLTVGRDELVRFININTVTFNESSN